MITPKQSNIRKYIIYILFYLLIIGNITFVFNKSIWYDEVYSLNLVEGNFAQIISGTAQDVHPPLYYLILKLGLLIGNGLLGINAIYVAKFISIIPIFLTVIINHKWVRKWAGEGIWLHSFCILVMPRIMSHAGIEIRMYSWAGLFVYVAFLFAVSILRDGDRTGHWVGLTLTALAASYCHYFACIAAFFVYLGLFIGLLIKRRGAKSVGSLLKSGGGILLGYLPWLFVLLEQLKTVGGDYWIAPIGRSACIQIMEYPFGDNATPPDMVCFIILITGVALALLSFGKIAHDSDLRLAFYAMSILALTVITGVVVSRLFRPIFLPRYMIPTLWSFWLGVCILTGKAGKIRKHIIVICLLLGGIYSFCHLYNEESFRGQQAGKLLADTELSDSKLSTCTEIPDTAISNVDASSVTDEGHIYITDSRHVYYVIKLYCGDADTVYLVRPGEEYESLSDVKDVQYAILLNDGPLKDEIDFSWEHLDDYQLEVYEVMAYKKCR